MKIFVICAVTLLACIPDEYAQGLEFLIGSDIQKCFSCFCHARSNCWSKFECARYSISRDYWVQSGSHTVYSIHYKDPYLACIHHANCILNTFKSYTDQFGETDCNCDGVFDYKDRLAIHLFGSSCYNPRYGPFFSKRFNDCAKQFGIDSMPPIEGNCEPEVF